MKAPLAVFLSPIALAVGAPIAASEEVPGETPSWRAVDAETGKIRDPEGLEQLARDFPDSGKVRLRMLQPYLAAGEPDKVMATLEWLYERGYVFGEVTQQQIPKLLEDVDPGRIAERLRAEAEVIEASEVIAKVPAGAGLVESVVSPGAEGFLVVTSITEQTAFASLDSMNWERLDISRANDLSGVVSDEERQIGWFASSNIDESEGGTKRFNGLIGLQRSDKDTLYVSAPQGVTLSDLALGRDGTVYASDPLGGGIYLAAPDAEQLDTLIAPGTLRSPQGLAPSEDGSKLYVSDYRYGIAIVDLETRVVSRLASDIPAILDGVDGLWLHGNELIAMQNGTSPMRISAFKLSEDGMRVVGHRILEQAHPEWTEPLGGSIVGGALYYVATGQWDRYVKGEPVADKPAIPTEIRRLPLE